MKRSGRFAVFFLVMAFAIVLEHPALAGSESRDKVKALVERECTHLDQQKLLSLIDSRFPAEMEGELPPDLLRIMEGVIKRTDFDTISEEKTVELIELVYGAFRKGAPLDQLDKIFDVAYAKTVSVDRLAAWRTNGTRRPCRCSPGG
jgi:hypothetical protein